MKNENMNKKKKKQVNGDCPEGKTDYDMDNENMKRSDQKK